MASSLFTRARSHSRLLGVLLLLGGLAVAAAWSADLGARGSSGERRLGERRQAPRAKPRKEEEEEEKPAPPAARPGNKRPRAEEEEEPAPTKKVVRPQAPGKEKPKPEPGHRVIPDTGDLSTAARKTSNPALKELFSRLAIPYDLAGVRGHETRINGEIQLAHDEPIAPIAPYVGDNPSNLDEAIDVTPVNRKTGQPNRKKHKLSRGTIRYVKHYEETALDVVQLFFKACTQLPETERLSKQEQLQAAEFALAFVVRWHESAVSTHVRQEKGWESVEKALRQQLLDLEVQQLTLITEEKNWDAAFALARRLSDAYRSPSDQAAIAKPLIVLLETSLKDDPLGGERGQLVQKRLHDLMELLPNSKECLGVAEHLRKQAEQLLAKARTLKDTNPTEAQRLLKHAEDTWPELPGLRDFRMDLNRSHPVLRVGVHDLPVYMAPGWASTDSELRTVEMLFESLVKFSADSRGVARYQPALSVGRPQVIPLGRRLRLPVNAFWSDNERLNATDVRSTVTLYKQRQMASQPGRAYLSPAWGELLEGAEVRGDRVDVTLRQGYLEPLSLMTFKVLPGHRLRQLGTRRAWEAFAKNPVGSGPFRLADPNRPRLSEPIGGREYMGFLANPSYGSRPGKLGLPLIREIRMYTSRDPILEVANGKLDLALDLTVEQAARAAQGDSGVQLLLPGPTTPNRRIYFLAVNHHKAPLNHPEVRRALALALNRKKLLDDHLRGSFGVRIHKILNGPYPAGSWACSPDVKADLLDVDGAQAAVAELKGQRPTNTKLQLKYPNNDAALEKAMRALCQQVKQAHLGIELEPVAEDPSDLRRDVEEDQNYELAYYHHDFNDETYWLWPLLGPGNYLNYEEGQVHVWLRKIMGHRNFAQVRQDTHLVHRSFLTLDMPIIPLWQLDPLAAVARDRLRTGPFDPLRVFSNVETWELNAK